jgi:GntR family transcriptional regulator
MVDPLNPVPFYEQVADAIAARIKAGEWEPGALIPSEGTLQEEYGVARGTIRRALELLRERGVVVTMPQRGTYVTQR